MGKSFSHVSYQLIKIHKFHIQTEFPFQDSKRCIYTEPDTQEPPCIIDRSLMELSWLPLVENQASYFQSVILKTQWLLEEECIFRSLKYYYRSFLLDISLIKQMCFIESCIFSSFAVGETRESKLHFIFWNYLEMRVASAATRMVHIDYSIEWSFIVFRKIYWWIESRRRDILQIISLRICSLCTYFNIPHNTATTQKDKMEQKYNHFPVE